MIFETLNDNVMLVELSGEEMEHFHITYDLLNNDNENVRFAIKNLLHKIDTKNRLSKGEKVIVEAMPTENGGCFFIFTFTPASKRKYRLKRKDKFLIFSTEKLDNLLDFISIIKTERVNQNCELFNMENEFFIVIPESNEKLMAIVSEYGEIHSNVNYLRLKEYGKYMGNIYLQ